MHPQLFWDFVQLQFSYYLLCSVFLFTNTNHILLHTTLLSLSFLATSSTIFHFPLCPTIGTSWCNQMISVLNFLFFSTYNFPSFNTNSPSILHSSLYINFTPTFFISSTILITSLSLLLAFFIFPTISTSGPSIITFSILQSQLSLIII